MKPPSTKKKKKEREIVEPGEKMDKIGAADGRCHHLTTYLSKGRSCIHKISAFYISILSTISNKFLTPVLQGYNYKSKTI